MKYRGSPPSKGFAPISNRHQNAERLKPRCSKLTAGSPYQAWTIRDTSKQKNSWQVINCKYDFSKKPSPEKAKEKSKPPAANSALKARQQDRQDQRSDKENISPVRNQRRILYEPRTPTNTTNIWRRTSKRSTVSRSWRRRESPAKPIIKEFRSKSLVSWLRAGLGQRLIQSSIRKASLFRVRR